MSTEMSTCGESCNSLCLISCNASNAACGPSQLLQFHWERKMSFFLLTRRFTRAQGIKFLLQFKMCPTSRENSLNTAQNRIVLTELAFPHPTESPRESLGKTIAGTTRPSGHKGDGAQWNFTNQRGMPTRATSLTQAPARKGASAGVHLAACFLPKIFLVRWSVWLVRSTMCVWGRQVQNQGSTVRVPHFQVYNQPLHFTHTQSGTLREKLKTSVHTHPPLQPFSHTNILITIIKRVP